MVPSRSVFHGAVLCGLLAWPVCPASAQESASRGRLYVPVYSSIAAGGGATRIDLAATLSLRNPSSRLPVTIERADYYDTAGKLLRAYLAGPTTVPPLGVYEIVIADRDVAGGSGAKFLIDWTAPRGGAEPIGEAVMIGVVGAAGYSFLSVGRAAPREE